MMLTGDNGILTRAGEAKEKTDEANEKEKIALAVNAARIKSLGESATAKSLRTELKAQGQETSIFQDGENIEIDFLDTNNSYVILSNGDIEELKRTTSEAQKVYYKIDGTTLLFNNSKKDDNYKEVGTYYFISIDDYNFPDWVGKITINESGGAVFPSPTIEKVIVENRIQPSSTALWFYFCKQLKEIENIENIDTRYVTDMSGMFYYCTGLISLDLSNFNTRYVTDMHEMFHRCTGLTNLDVSSFNTRAVTTMRRMFAECANLSKLDLSNFDTSNVNVMTYMFSRCQALSELDLSNFDTRNVLEMEGLFETCTNLSKLNLSSFDTSNVGNMSYMFYKCFNLTTLDLESFDTSKVNNMRSMFYGCARLNKIYVDEKKFILKEGTTSVGMFAQCLAIEGENGTKYNYSKIDGSMAHIDLNGNPGYFSLKID